MVKVLHDTMNGCRIAIIHDEASAAMGIEDRLAAMGFELAGRAASGEKPLELIEQQHPDVVLMDIRLQGAMGGIAVAEEILKKYRIPVIFLTAHSEEATLTRAKLAQPCSYVLKPFNDRELKSVIEMALYRHRAEEEIRRLNRLYDVLSYVSQAVVRTETREELFSAVCRLMVERAPIDLAWIGWFDDNSSGLTPVACFGKEHLLKSAAGPSSRGTSNEVILKGEPFLCNQCIQEVCLHPAARQHAAFGYRSCGSFPLRLRGKVRGTLNLCSTESGFFREREIELLQRVCTDISFALDKIESDTRSGGIGDIVIPSEDITEQKRLQEERPLIETRLRQVQRMEALGTLAGGIAHDFNNILGIIIGYTEIALSALNERGQKMPELQEVLKAANRARELVQQILAFSRLREQEKKPVQVGLIVKEAMKMLRASLPSTVDVKMNIASKALVLGDPTQIHQVLMNLCTNAAHAMRDGKGVLEVSLTDAYLNAVPPHSGLKAGPYLKLVVKDTGQGIDPSILDRIFDPFFTTKEHGVGTGLGLSVVHGIVKSYAGAIEVKSLPEVGTTFEVILPALETAQALEETSAAPLPQGRERILVVDDEPALAIATKQMLQQLGYAVVSQANPIEALECFRLQLTEEPFDLVLTDMTMPHLTGVELARELLKLRHNLPVLLCTGFSEKINAAEALRIGIRSILMKPVTVSELAVLIRGILDARDT